MLIWVPLDFVTVLCGNKRAGEKKKSRKQKKQGKEKPVIAEDNRDTTEDAAITNRNTQDIIATASQVHTNR